MPIEFVHIADIHLGYHQYGHKERFNDFGHAFLWAIEYAVDHEVDFVLISGDLFHKSSIEPLTFLQAVSGLVQLREANIPVIAIVGNHDRAGYRARFSWLAVLSERGYIKLLSPTFAEKGTQLLPWDGSDGAYVDIGPLRIYGIPYLGASLKSLLPELPALLTKEDTDNAHFTILVGHFGLEGEMPGVPGGIPQNDIAALHEHIDYLALGHWHKPYEREGWVYNPGSLEACSMDERRWSGGLYHITVNTDENPKHTARHVPCPRRPFHRLVFKIDKYESPEALYDSFSVELKAEAPKVRSADNRAPVVEVSLEGILAFERTALDLEHLQRTVKEFLSPLIIRIKNNTSPTDFEIAPEGDIPRTQLEQQIFQDLIRRDGRYRQQAEEWAKLMSEVKGMALRGSPPEAIVETLREYTRETELRDADHTD